MSTAGVLVAGEVVAVFSNGVVVAVLVAGVVVWALAIAATEEKAASSNKLSTVKDSLGFFKGDRCNFCITITTRNSVTLDYL